MHCRKDPVEKKIWNLPTHQPGIHFSIPQYGMHSFVQPTNLKKGHQATQPPLPNGPLVTRLPSPLLVVSWRAVTM